MNKQIGKLNKKVIELLDLEYKSEIPIILGDSNNKIKYWQASSCQIKIVLLSILLFPELRDMASKH